jgi:hypothetical protein
VNSDLDGGVFYVSQYSSIKIIDSTFYGCIAGGGSGGVLYLNSELGEYEIRNVEFGENLASNNGTDIADYSYGGKCM